MKDYPITTKAGKRQYIKTLSKNMERRFLDKIDKIPDNWDGIEIRAWMATIWENEYPWPKNLTAITLKDRDYKRRQKDFKNDLLVRNL